MNEKLTERLNICLENALERKISDFSPQLRLREDLGMESLELVMLQVALEDEFNFSFDPIEDDFEEIFATIGGLYRYVREKCAM